MRDNVIIIGGWPGPDEVDPEHIQDLDRLHEQLWFAVVDDPDVPLTTIQRMNEAKAKLDAELATGSQEANAHTASPQDTPEPLNRDRFGGVRPPVGGGNDGRVSA